MIELYMGRGFITRPTSTEKLYKADLYIRSYYNHEREKLEISVDKNRNGPSGVICDDTNMEPIIDLIASELTKVKFQNRNKLFQENVKADLSNAIKKVLIKDYEIPTQRAIKEYIEGGHTK